MNNILKTAVNTITKEKVISKLIKKGYSTRVELSKEIGVTTATLTKISKDLIEDGILNESGEIEDGKVGRRQKVLMLNPDFCYSIGIDVSLNFARVIVLNLAIEEVFEKEWVYDSFNNEILDEIIKVAKREIDSLGFKKILGVGLLLQGMIENDESLILPVKDIKKQIEANLNIDVLLFNNIRGLAKVENFFELNKDNFLLIKYGPGVGGVFSINGEVVEGFRGRAGEIGHIKWNSKSKHKCPICGKTGCLESEIHFNNIKTEFLPNKYDDVFIKENKENLLQNVNELSEAISICIDILDPNEVLIAGSIFDDDEIFNKLKDNVCENTKTFCDSNICKVSNYEEKTKKASALIVFAENLD